MNPRRFFTLKLYSFAFVDGFILIFPLYTLFLSDHGLSTYQISSLLIAWSVSMFLLELPSGVLADKFSRRNILIVGEVAKIVGFGFWLFMPSYIGFLIGFILWGAKVAFSVGTQEAFVYEELKNQKMEKKYSKVTGGMQAMASIGYIMAGFGAALLAKRGYSLILVLTIIMALMATAILFLLPNSQKSIDRQAIKYIEHVKSGLKIVFRQTKVFYIVAFMSVVFGFGIIDEFFSLLFREKGLTNSRVAIWIGIIYLFGALGNLLAHKLDGRKIPTIFSLGLWVLLLILAGKVSGQFAPLVLAIYMFYFSGLVVLMQTYLQREIEDRMRATIFSIAGVFIEMISLLGYVVFALGVHHRNYSMGFYYLAGLIAIFTLALLIGFRKLWIIKDHNSLDVKNDISKLKHI